MKKERESRMIKHTSQMIKHPCTKALDKQYNY